MEPQVNSTPPLTQQPLLMILGPTAAGKSALAVRLAKEIHAEIVSADSQQVYRFFNIGTGKLHANEREGIPHHLIDVVDPNDSFSAADFVALADDAIREIASRGRAIIVVGGTGLYVKALLHGLFPSPQRNTTLHKNLFETWHQGGAHTLFERLQNIDPKAAERIHPNDFIRISRAIEVFEQTGIPISSMQRQHGFAEQRYKALQIGIRPDRSLLRDNIEARVDAMLNQGWLEEVIQLLHAGYENTRPMQALGYRQLKEHLTGHLSLPEAGQLTKRDTWRFARRQLNWFRCDETIRWFTDADLVQGDWVQKYLLGYMD